MHAVNLKQFETVRTTITLPATLLQRTQAVVDSGRVPNRNALMVTAIEQFLQDLEREEIDRQFAAMADDLAFQAEQIALAESFADSDWEALVEGEVALR